MERIGLLSLSLAMLVSALPVSAQEAPDAGDEASTSSPAAITWGAPEELRATEYAELLGQGWSDRSGCTGEWRIVWKVAGGEFSLVPGGETSVSGASAHHAVCETFRAVGDFGVAKVGATVLGGVIRRVAVLSGGAENAAARKSDMTSYFDAACSKRMEEIGSEAFDVLYRDCGGFDVGLAEGETDLSLYFFGDHASFRARMNDLPMPTKPDD